IYLDTSVYNRPFDDLSQPRIWFEAAAFAAILRLVEEGRIELVSSDVLRFENRQSPSPQRRAWVGLYLGLAPVHQTVDESIRARAKAFEEQGIKPIDALHLACAEAADAHDLLTCDDDILKRYTESAMNAENPIHFVLEEASPHDGGPYEQ
ncbi:MAG: type II toxin-antitoxin system VapC family toxin, partial [Candidatus Bipolaricaulia bacterium]